MIKDLDPGTVAWSTVASSSKVPAMLGLSTYDSPFSLWHRMAGLSEWAEGTDLTARGNYLEPAICAWFADQHPELEVMPGGTWINDSRPWQVASPDRRVFDTVGDNGWALVEAKSAANSDEWGEPGTDQIPIGYKVQALWQMDTLGIHTTYVPVITSYLNFAEYVVHYDEADALYIREQVTKFMDSLPTGSNPRRPDIDTHSVTYQVIKELHPLLNGDEIEVAEDVAVPFLKAQAELKAAKETEQQARSRLAEAMGNYSYATHNDTRIARRQAKGDSAPYVVAITPPKPKTLRKAA